MEDSSLGKGLGSGYGGSSSVNGDIDGAVCFIVSIFLVKQTRIESPGIRVSIRNDVIIDNAAPKTLVFLKVEG